MSSKVWGIVGAVVCFTGFKLLNYRVGKTAGYLFVAALVIATLVAHLIYRRRLQRLQDDVAALTEEDRNRFLQEIDPEIAEDLRKKDDHKTDA